MFLLQYLSAMKNVNFHLKQQPILVSDIPSPASFLSFCSPNRITIQYHSQGRALQSQQKITRLAGEGCIGVECYSSGTRLKERISQGQIWKSQQLAVRHTLHKSTQIQGVSSHVAPKFYSISQQFAIPGLHSKLSSPLIQKSKVRENNIYTKEINPTSCHAFCALFSFAVFNFNFVFQIWVMARKQELELLHIKWNKINL